MALSGSVGSYQEFGYTGGMQSVTIPADGIYKLECYGGKGGDGNGSAGGKGGYSVGYILLQKNTVLYVCVGGAGTTASGNGYVAGAYNGGGGTSGDYGESQTWSGTGGGATHIATVTGTLQSIGAANLSKILIVAGGGGGGTWHSVAAYYRHTGGTGGGLEGGSSSSGQKGGTQTSGYAFGVGKSRKGVGGGGGGGLWGGFQEAHAGGGGGSGYIGGVPSFTYNGVTYSPSTSNGQSNGNGYARITFAALSKIYKLNVDGSVVQTVYLDGVALEQIKFDGVSVFGNP